MYSASRAPIRSCATRRITATCAALTDVEIGRVGQLEGLALGLLVLALAHDVPFGGSSPRARASALSRKNAAALDAERLARRRAG